MNRQMEGIVRENQTPYYRRFQAMIGRNLAKRYQGRTPSSKDVIANRDEGHPIEGRHPEPALSADRPVEGKAEAYEDTPGYSKSATLKEIAANDYVLTPGRFVGMAEVEDDGIPFEEKMVELSGRLYEQMQESESLDQAIKENLKRLVYEE